jgi:23S rRNA pseudoU1915 N3-methylase RlmH
LPRTAKFRPQSFSCKKFSNDQASSSRKPSCPSHTQPTDNTYTYTHNTATMAKTENDIRVTKEKKDKKRKADDEVEDVSEKKDKKKKRKSVDADGDAVMDASVAEIVEAKEDNEEKAVVAIGALVPFANPLADEKQQKKVLKAVKKCMRRISVD